MNTRFDPELSRLAFEDRLIEYCEDPSIPVLERVRLLAIFSERLDVFFMTRVGRLKRLATDGEQKAAAPTAPDEQLTSLAVEGHRMIRRAYALCDALLAELDREGVCIEPWDQLDDEDREYLSRVYGRMLGAVVTPVIIEQSQRFPHVRNLRPALLATGRRPGAGMPSFVIVEMPADLPRLVSLGREHRFVPLEQVIAAELPSLVPGLAIQDAHLFRVTRNAHTELDDDDDVLRDFEQEIVRRPFQEVVRLEVEQSMPADTRARLLHEFACERDVESLGLSEEDVYVVNGLVDLTALESLADLPLPHLKVASVTPRPSRVEQLLEPAPGDALMHFPFDDYETSIEWFLHEAARHPDLVSLHTTIYRTDKDSDVVRALCSARARGRDATAIVELKASFDERGNIGLARALEKAGVRVVLSPPTLKVHAKVALATFRGEHGGAPRRVALIGTGNMNAVTARSYIDVWLMTGDPALTSEVASVFDFLTGEAPAGVSCDRLLVSPIEMRRRFLELIHREAQHAAAGRPAGIRAMMNGLSDPTLITMLYHASQNGVPIDLMVRGVCLARPETPGLSENLRIVSVAGHLLQHARIFHFRNGGDDEWFIGSADWRPRNFDVRVEVVANVTRPEHTATLERILTDTLSAPDAWVLGADGVYRRERD